MINQIGKIFVNAVVTIVAYKVAGAVVERTLKAIESSGAIEAARDQFVAVKASMAAPEATTSKARRSASKA